MTFHPHPALHPVFEALGYFLGYCLYKHQRARSGDHLTDEHRWLLLAATTPNPTRGAP